MSDVLSLRLRRGIFVAGRDRRRQVRSSLLASAGHASLAIGIGLAGLSSQALADCVASGVNATTCNTNTPNPYTARVGAGNVPGGDNQTVTVDLNAAISPGNNTAISLRDNANITVNGTVENYATSGGGAYGTGLNTIEFRNNGTLTISATGKVLSNGTQRNAEAINVQGSGNTIINDGLINSVAGAAIWSEKQGTLTVVNNGTISTGSLLNPSLTAAVIGGNTNAGIDFTNRGTVYGSLNLGSGADTLRLYTGSTITGNFSGGGGEDSIYFNGTGSDSLGGTMTGFEHLIKQDSGTWELTGSITGLTDASVQAGTLILSGNNSGFTGTTTVSSGATLQGRAQSLPTAISNDGLVRFDQPDTGVYSGVISGAGGVEKTGAGIVTLTGNLGYGGATTVSEGTLILTGNNAGYTGGGVVASGATLQGSSQSLPSSIADDGLVIFDQRVDGVYAGVISGSGALEKTGHASLTISADQSYTGVTDVSDGALILTGSLTSDTSVASGATLRGTGSITGDLFNAGTVAPGTESSIGTLTINGSYVGIDGTLASRVGGTPETPVADVLRISGAGSTASGATSVRVTDAGGLGAPTTGDGILLIEAANGATTGQGSFALGERVAGGAYEYNLVRGRSSGTGENWYLSTYVEPPVPPDPEPEPAYRVETSNYTALPALQRLYTYGLVDTLEQRRGSPAIMAAATPDDGTAVWGRAGGNFGETYGSGSDGLDMSYGFGFLQAGIDAISASDGHGGRIESGLFIAMGSSSTDTSTQADGKTGDASFLAFTGGLYGTWVAENGFYGDLLGQVTGFTNADARSSGSESISTTGWSESLSLEAGYRVSLGERLALVPQGQIIAENFSLDDTSDDFGDVGFDNGFAARGRLGLELASRIGGEEERTDVTLRANVWHVFADNPQTTFSSLEGTNPVDFTADVGTSWLAVDAGFTTAIGEHASLFVNAGYEYGFEDTRQAGTGRVGFTADW